MPVNKKNSISVILSIILIVSEVNCFAAAEKEEQIYQTQIDLSKYYNSMVYLSEEKEGTIKNAEAPDWFMDNVTGTGIPIAINRDNVIKNTDGGVLNVDGIKYNLEISEDKPGGIYMYPYMNISVPEDYYSEYRIIAISDATERTNDDLYSAAIYSDNTKTNSPFKNIKPRANVADKSGLVC